MSLPGRLTPMDATEFRLQYSDLLQPDPPAETWGWFLQPGSSVRYSVIGHLGQGGFGDVFLAVNEQRFQPVALKLLCPNRLTSSSVWNFVREQALSKEVSSRPGSRWIVPVVDTGYFSGPPPGSQNALFLAMNYVPGRTLRSLLDTWKRLPVEEVLRIGIELCKGLQVLHADNGQASDAILHRDLKPQNLIFDSFVHGEVRIADLGVAIKLNEPNRTGVNGTPEYIAPEIWMGMDATIASDLYSLGCILYEMLRGQVPLHLTIRAQAPYMHRAPADRDLARTWHLEDGRLRIRVPDMPGLHIPGVPGELDELVLALLSKDPRDRPKSASDVLSWLSFIHTQHSSGFRQAIHPDWPRAHDPSVVDRLRILASNQLNLPEAWLDTATGTTTALGVRLSLSLSVLRAIDKMTTDVQKLIGLVQVKWSSGFNIPSAREARRSVNETFNNVISLAHPIKQQVTGLPAFFRLMDDLERIATRFYSRCLLAISRSDPAGLESSLFAVRSQLLLLQREAVNVYSMAADRLLAESIRS